MSQAIAILDTLPSVELEMTLRAVNSSGLPAKGKEGRIEKEGKPFRITKQLNKI